MKKLVATAETEEWDVFLTPWSLVHLACGGVARQAGIGFWWWQLAHAGYEAKDFLLTQNGEQYNSLYNSVGDQLVTTLGYYLGKHGTLKTWGFGLAGTFTTMILLDDRVG